MGRKFFTVSFDDGTEQDIRVIALMEKYGIRGTFNLSSSLFGEREEGVERIVNEVLPEGTVKQVKVRFDHNIMPVDQANEVYSREFIEIAGHGSHHLHQAGLGRAALEAEIADDAKRLSDIFCQMVTGHIFPYGEYDEECLQVMKEAGLTYGRLATSGANKSDFRFKCERSIIQPTCRMTDYFSLPLLQNFIDAKANEDLVFYIWGHSFELDYGTMNGCDAHLEEIFKTAAEAEDIEFVTNGELIETLGK